MSDIYESDKLLSEYLLFHYGAPDEILPPDRPWPAGMREALDFAARTPRHFSSGETRRGLDLGCAVGRSTFEMSRRCKEVLGIDYSHSFIAAAEALRRGESIEYERLEEATVRTGLSARRPGEALPARVTFQQGDAMHLPAGIDRFDRVHAANLLCRLSDPQLLIDRLPSLVVPGGELVLATPCTWLEEFTPRKNWPNGTTLDWLKSSLSREFELVHQTEEPFLIRETARKFQWTCSLATVWRRKI